jgi:XapX domain-containing protein
MKAYLLSLGAGLVVGIVYHLLNVRSPAPPVIALIGLLGMLMGEQLIPVAKRIAGWQPEVAAQTNASAPPAPSHQSSDEPGDNA